MAKKKVLFFPMMSTGHLSLGLTFMKYLHSKLGDSCELLVLSDSTYETKILQMCPCAKIRLIKNPLASQELDSLKEEDTNLKMMDQFASSWDSSLEEKFKSQVFAFSMMVNGYKTQKSVIENIIKEEKPDYILFDNLFSVPYLMNKNIPWGFICSANPLFIQYNGDKLPPFGSGFPSNLSPENEAKWKEYRSKYQEINQPFQDLLNEWFKDEGLNETLPNGVSIIGSSYVNIYLYPKEINYENLIKESQFKGNWVSVDSCILPEKIRLAIGEKIPQLNLDLNSFPDKNPNRRLIYFSLGTLVSTQPNVMQRIIDMFESIEHNFIVSKGARGNQIKLPSNCIGKDFIPQTQLLEKIDLMISHGGNNTFTECFHYGVPLIIMPVFGDQPDNAVRLEELGLGKHLNLFNCTRDELNNAIQDVLSNTSISQKMKIISKRIQNEIGGWEEVYNQMLPYLS